MKSERAAGFLPITRRSFLTKAAVGLAAGGAPAVSSPFISRALAQTKTLTIIQWSHFVPAFDKWFDKFAQEWGSKNGISVTVDHIPEQNIAARAAAEASAGAGHDLFMWNGAGGPHLYRKFLLDLTSLVEAVEKKYGKVSILGQQICFNQDDKTWSAYPDYYINNPGQYRKDLWDEIGMHPTTWDDVRVGGAKLKAKGHPVGLSLGHSNDPSLCWRGVLWSYGASVQDQSGKHVVLDSKEAVEAVKFVAALYKEAMTTDVLSWDDSSNNKYIDSGVGSFIVNPISAYRTCQQINPKLADNIFFEKCPKGPVKQLVGSASNSYGIWKFAKNQEAAKDFLMYYADNWVEAFKASTGYNMPIFPNIVPKPMPILSNDPTSHPPTKLQVTETSDEWCAATGYPGPAWAATDEIYNSFIINDMMTKAATGAMTPEESVKWAANECKLIFKKWEA
ncbi:MAG TPA: extracellular solute-binding protein [Stellaceae bacterium]|nr:extracellular solute-binding protein [Stellaceae bacterium]